jgi:hypothetical protein
LEDLVLHPVLNHMPGVLVAGAAPHCFCDLRSFHPLVSLGFPPSLKASLPPGFLWELFSGAPFAAEGWDVQNDTQSVEIFMNELCRMISLRVCKLINLWMKLRIAVIDWRSGGGVGAWFLSNQAAAWWLMHHKYTKLVARRNKAGRRGWQEFILWYLMNG